MKLLFSSFFVLCLVTSGNVHAAVPATRAALADRLGDVKQRVIKVEQNLIDSLKNQKNAKESYKKIQELIQLQRQERNLALGRTQELEKTIADLETKRGELRTRVDSNRAQLRKSLLEITRMAKAVPETPDAIDRVRIEQPRVKTLKNMASLGVSELETLRADLSDAEALEGRIAEERSQLDAVMHELAESEGILELNKRLQIDLIQQSYSMRTQQLERYRSLKLAEMRVSDLIQDFNARMEIQTENKKERHWASMMQTPFGKSKGLLPYPVAVRKLVNGFGKSYDLDTGLAIFKKGLDIDAGSNEPVKAVFDGKVAFSGTLPGYGRMLILDHGDHFYTLVGNLGSSSRKVGDQIAQGEVIGVTDPTGKPVYFEIRARNIPVNPLQWVAHSSTMK